MADLGTLELGTFTSVLGTGITGAEPVLQAIASADDAKDVHDTSNTTHVGVAQFTLEDTPADFGNVDTVSIRLRYGLSAAPDLNVWNSLTAQIVESDGATPLTDEVTLVSGPITAETPTNSAVVPLTNPNTAASKETWNAALVMIRFNVTKNKGGDAVEERVFAAEVTGTYTAAAAGGDVTFAATIDSASAISPSLGLERAAAATMTSFSTVAASLLLSLGLAATAASASQPSSSLSVDRSVAAALAAESALASEVTVEREMAATISSESAASAALSIQGSVELSATVASESSVTGSLAVERSYSASLDTLSVVAVELGCDRALGVEIAGASMVAVTTDVERGLAPILASESAVAVHAEVSRPLAATIASESGVQADIHIAGIIRLSAIVSATSAGAAVLAVASDSANPPPRVTLKAGASAPVAIFKTLVPSTATKTKMKG